MSHRVTKWPISQYLVKISITFFNFWIQFRNIIISQSLCHSWSDYFNLISESSQKALKNHAFELHGEPDGDRVQCRVADSCQLSFDSRETFFEHLTTTHNDASKSKMSRQLFCDFPHCYFVTEKSFNLAQHLRKHNDERSFAW